MATGVLCTHVLLISFDTRMRRRARVSRELKNHDEVQDDDLCWLEKYWNENVSFGRKKET